jgi:large subunit ribosomal protein L19
MFLGEIAYSIAMKAMKKKEDKISGADRLQDFNKKVRQSAKKSDLRAGDIIKVHRKIKEGAKERIQVFEGIVISVKGKQSSSPIVTVRKVSFGIGVELAIPVCSPIVSKIEVVKRAKTRQSKLYYLRDKDFRLSKLRMKELGQFVAKKEEESSKEEDLFVADPESVEKKDDDASKKKEDKLEENKDKESQGK